MAPSAPLDLRAVAGAPLHTRTLVVEAHAQASGVRARGEIVDLRKTGFVPTGGDLQTAGLIHHMTLELQVALESREITRLDASQPHLAFRACEATGGDACSDPLPNLQALVGTAMDAGFVGRLGAAFGGPLGCSHLLTLAQWMGSLLPRIDAAERPRWGVREEGERVFKATLVLDGADTGDGLGVFLQSNEFQLRPRREVATPLERLEHQTEVQVCERIDLETMQLETLDAAMRVRTLDDFEAEWRAYGPEFEPWIGGPAVGGLAGKLLAHFRDRPDERPLLDALLNLSPGAIQCMAALSDRILAAVTRRNDSEEAAAAVKAAPVMSVGGLPNSCYMWRDGGAMQATRFGEDGAE